MVTEFESAFDLELDKRFGLSSDLGGEGGWKAVPIFLVRPRHGIPPAPSSTSLLDGGGPLGVEVELRPDGRVLSRRVPLLVEIGLSAAENFFATFLEINSLAIGHIILKLAVDSIAVGQVDQANSFLLAFDDRAFHLRPVVLQRVQILEVELWVWLWS